MMLIRASIWRIFFLLTGVLFATTLLIYLWPGVSEPDPQPLNYGPYAYRRIFTQVETEVSARNASNHSGTLRRVLEPLDQISPDFLTSPSASRIITVPSFFHISPTALTRQMTRLVSIVDQIGLDAPSSSIASSSPFSCQCGRISEPCQCCGLLVDANDSVDDDPLVIYPMADAEQQDGKAFTTRLCFNITYLVKHQSVRLGAVMYPSTSPKTNQIASSPSLVLFNNLVLSVPPESHSSTDQLPIICIDNSALKPKVALCATLSQLDYRVSSTNNLGDVDVASSGDSKTAFEGCGSLRLVESQHYKVLVDYGNFCFRSSPHHHEQEKQSPDLETPSAEVLASPTSGGGGS